MTWLPFRWLIRAIRSGAAAISISPAQAASPPWLAGQISALSMPTAAMAAGSTPATGAMRPSKPSSPSARCPSSASLGIASIASSRPSAMGRS